MADDDIEDSLADGATTAAPQPEADAGTSYEEDPGREGESAATAPVETASGIPLIDLGVLDSIDALVDLISTRPGAAGESSDQPGEPGSCSEAVRDHVQKIGANPISSFAAVLDGPTPASLDAQLVVRDDGTPSVLYAIEPDLRARHSEPGRDQRLILRTTVRDRSTPPPADCAASRDVRRTGRGGDTDR